MSYAPLQDIVLTARETDDLINVFTSLDLAASPLTAGFSFEATPERAVDWFVGVCKALGTGMADRLLARLDHAPHPTLAETKIYHVRRVIAAREIKVN